MSRTVPSRFGALAGILALSLLVSSSAAASNIVLNPGFEDGFSDWTQSGNMSFTWISESSPHSGAYAAWLGPFGSHGYLSQTLPTAPGTYALTLWLRNESGTPNHFAVYWGSMPVLDLNDAPGFGYEGFVFSGLVATGPTTLTFEFQHQPAYWHLDDVEVTRSSSVPDPGSSLLFLGMSLCGLSAWKQRLG